MQGVNCVANARESVVWRIFMVDLKLTTCAALAYVVYAREPNHSNTFPSVADLSSCRYENRFSIVLNHYLLTPESPCLSKDCFITQLANYSTLSLKAQ
ncbi:hypothetical protein OGCDGJMD_01459 [Cyanobium usitatum str. Tous]|jgi:hypothetical protein|nr:hypothetical protein OGCDGJMD_01459 [Cyanobium usitatum str. Tous]